MERLEIAKGLMLEFAKETGLEPASHQRRYLWTDAFAVCAFFELYRKTADPSFKELALRLIHQVHWILGRHRSDDERKGWLSGLSEEEGLRHPTIGGLRIGKRLPERKENEPFDPRAEWDRDGQYFHYLTKWMHALIVAYRETKYEQFVIWAYELAKTAFHAFSYEIHGRRLMYWKMSIDLKRPLVASMGQHDPVDGLVTFLEIQSVSQMNGLDVDLFYEIRELARICEHLDLITDDPLGIGGLLFDATRTYQLLGSKFSPSKDLFWALLNAASFGLRDFIASGELKRPANMRLAFRELGLSIGLAGIEKIKSLKNLQKEEKKNDFQKIIHEILTYYTVKKEIEDFWIKRENRKSGTWKEHKDINSVMLAVSLFPDAFLTIFD